MSKATSEPEYPVHYVGDATINATETGHISMCLDESAHYTLSLHDARQLARALLAAADEWERAEASR